MNILFDIYNFIIGLIAVIMYISCAVGIWGADDEKRYPFIGIPAQIAAYMLYIFINDGKEWSLGWIVWASLSIITVVLVIISFFSRKESSRVADITSLIVVALLAVPPFLSTTSINFSLQYSRIITIDEGLVIYGAGFLLLSVIGISILFYLVPQKKLLERISAKEDINKEEVVNQIKRNRVFRDPMISFVRQEILDQVNSLIDVIRQETASVKLSKKNRGNQKNVDSAFLNDIRDIRRMLQKLTKGEYEMFSIRDFVSDVKHSITTPLSRISVNADLLKKEVTTEKGIERLDHIYQSAQICQSVINSYSELVNKNLGDNIISIKKAAESFFEDSKDKDNKSVTLSDGTLPDNISGYSNSVVISALVPLIHNAVSASPIGGVVKMEYEETADSSYIRIRNLCEQGTPNVEKLSEQGFSTKHNHKGIGLQTVRNIVRLTKNSITLDFTIEEEKKEIEAILKLKKKIQNNETR